MTREFRVVSRYYASGYLHGFGTRVDAERVIREDAAEEGIDREARIEYREVGPWLPVEEGAA